MTGKWSTLRPDTPGRYVVCTSGGIYDFVCIECVDASDQLHVHSYRWWGVKELQEYADRFPLPLRWYKVVEPLSIDEIQAAELESM